MTVLIGRPAHAANRLLAEKAARHRPLIVVHRGVAAGSVAENTLAAVRAAVRSGGDIVEVDVVASTDGEYFVFHDGMEPVLLGIDENLADLPAARIRELRHRRVDGPERDAGVPALADLLGALDADTMINLDRSWPWWEELLPWLDRFDVTERILLKCHAGSADRVALLRAHPEPYPFAPICRTLDEVDAMIDDPALHTVAVELLASDVNSPFLAPGAIERIRDRGVLVLVNAEVLPSGAPLFAGLDDDRSVFDDAEAGWGALLALGADAIQTDWPWLLRDFRREREDA